jgi:hypothetical protein
MGAFRFIDEFILAFTYELALDSGFASSSGLLEFRPKLVLLGYRMGERLKGF